MKLRKMQQADMKAAELKLVTEYNSFFIVLKDISTLYLDILYACTVLTHTSKKKAFGCCKMVMNQYWMQKSALANSFGVGLLTCGGVYHLKVWVSNCYARQGQLGICFPSLHQVPIDVTAGWAASPVDTRPFKQLGRL